jgi:hypothetical protein
VEGHYNLAHDSNIKTIKEWWNIGRVE